jgi:hypothetical protein
MSGLRMMELPDVQMSCDSIMVDAFSENSTSTAVAPSRVD